MSRSKEEERTIKALKKHYEWRAKYNVDDLENRVPEFQKEFGKKPSVIVLYVIFSDCFKYNDYQIVEK